MSLDDYDPLPYISTPDDEIPLRIIKHCGNPRNKHALHTILAKLTGRHAYLATMAMPFIPVMADNGDIDYDDVSQIAIIDALKILRQAGCHTGIPNAASTLIITPKPVSMKYGITSHSIRTVVITVPVRNKEADCTVLAQLIHDQYQAHLRNAGFWYPFREMTPLVTSVS